MRIRHLFVHDYRGVDATISWAPAVVLFGRNDAGKSNILEALTSTAGLGVSRPDPLRAGENVSLFAVVELDRLDEATGFDAKLLAGLLQMRHVPPLFPDAFAGDPIPDRQREQDRWGGHLFLSQFPAPVLEWGHGPEAESEQRQFKIGCVGSPTSSDMLNAPGSLADVKEALHERALEYAGALVGEAGGEAQESFNRLLDSCLGSRWLVCDFAGGVSWLAPQSRDWTPEDVEAAHRLAAVFGDDRIPIVDGFVRGLVSGRWTGEPFLSIPDTHEFHPWDVVRVTASPERLETLATEVEDFVRSGLAKVLWEHEGADPWLSAGEQGTSVSEAVRQICEKLSEHATSIAPRFVTRGYEVRVEPLEQDQWHQYRDRRVRLALVRTGQEESFDLAVVGSGLAVWAAFAIEEAMREVDVDLERELARVLADFVNDVDEDEQELGSHDAPEIGDRSRLYVLDEPERHLHPEAQKEAARWLASRIDGATSFLLATHALAFLSLPASDVEYALVSRDDDGVSHAESITGDLWGALDARVSEAGVGSRAELIQVVRAFLIVEGAHDELVLRHFYGDVLARERVVILPVRGAKKVRSLIEAELLAKIDKPLIILFDDVRAAAVVRREKPSRSDISVYALWETLQRWPRERKQPHVVEFVLPDIFAALPDQCVRQVVEGRGGSFAGWRGLIKDFSQQSTGVGFKEFFVAKTGLRRDTDLSELLVEILDRCRVTPTAELQRAMQEVLDRVGAESGTTPSFGRDATPRVS